MDGRDKPGHDGWVSACAGRTERIAPSHSHARACRGHPRLFNIATLKTWMAWKARPWRLGLGLRGDERNGSLRPTVMPALVAGIHAFSTLQL